MPFNIQEIFGVLGDRRRQIVAETLASMAHDRLSEHFTEPLFEREWVNQRLGNTSVLAKEVIAVACHGMAGVAHTFSFSDGLISEFSSRVLGDTLSDIAGKVRRSQAEPSVITLNSKDFTVQDREVIFDAETQALATERLTAKFEEDRSQDKTGHRSNSRFGRFIDTLGASIKEEVRDVVEGLRQLTRTMDADRKRMKRNPFSRRRG